MKLTETSYSWFTHQTTVVQWHQF